MFDYFLKGDSDSIGFEELKNMFAMLGECVSDGDVSKMILMADHNQDGRLDF